MIVFLKILTNFHQFKASQLLANLLARLKKPPNPQP